MNGYVLKTFDDTYGRHSAAPIPHDYDVTGYVNVHPTRLPDTYVGCHRADGAEK